MRRFYGVHGSHYSKITDSFDHISSCLWTLPVWKQPSLRKAFQVIPGFLPFAQMGVSGLQEFTDWSEYPVGLGGLEHGRAQG